MKYSFTGGPSLKRKLYKMKTKRILVTGGAGFIGSHLCRKLLSLGHHVICLDNFYTGSMNNIDDMIGNKNFEVINDDVRTMSFKAKVDEIYNLACPASPRWYQEDPIRTFTTCIQGAINVLELAKEFKSKVLQASTSEVYGDPDHSPQEEKYWGNVNPIGIRSCYDEGKRGAETLFMDYHRQYGVDIRIIRIFNTYGPGMAEDDGRVISNFICQALKGEDITIYGDGSQTRSFQYVDDLVERMIVVMNSSYCEPINIGNPYAEWTIKGLAEKIIKLSNSKSKIIYEELPMDDPKQRRPDMTTFFNMFPAFKSCFDLDEGLKRTISYFNTKIQRDLKIINL